MKAKLLTSRILCFNFKLRLKIFEILKISKICPPQYF